MPEKTNLYVFSPEGENLALCSHAEDAAALVALHGFGATIRVSIRPNGVVWSEGEEAVSATDSYDTVAETVAERIRTGERVHVNRSATDGVAKGNRVLARFGSVRLRLCSDRARLITETIPEVEWTTVAEGNPAYTSELIRVVDSYNLRVPPIARIEYGEVLRNLRPIG